MDEKILQELKHRRNQSESFYKDWDYVGEEVFLPGRAGDIRTLFYYPEKVRKDMPVFFDIHGGGHTVHKAEADQPFCRQLIQEMQGIVISIDYRLAPEYQWPVQINEVYDVILHIVRNAEQYQIDPMRMGIGGHSAGGNLAAITALLANEKKEFLLQCQVLNYPEVDFSKTPKEKFAGKAEEMVAELDFFNRCYLRHEEVKNPHFSPIYASREQMKGLPPAVVVLCENDILYREGLEYAVKLVESGVETTTKLFFGVEHGFTADYYYTEEGQQGIEFMIDSIKRYLL